MPGKSDRGRHAKSVYCSRETCGHTKFEHFHWDVVTGHLLEDDRSCTVCKEDVDPTTRCAAFKD